MKKEIAFQFLLFPVVFLLWYLLYHETLAGIEEYSFYVCTSDYRSLILSKPGGLGILTGNFLSQFYRWRETGSILQTVFPFFILGVYNYILFRAKKDGIWMGTLLILPFIRTQLDWLNIGISVQIILFLGVIALYLFIKQTYLRRIIFMLTPFVLLAFIPAGFVLLFYLIAVFLEYFFYDKQFKSLLWPLLGLTTSGILLYLWNRQWFIPTDERLFYSIEQYPLYMVIFLYCTPLLLLTSARYIHFHNKWLKIVVTIFAAALLTAIFYTDTPAREKEKRIAIEHDTMVSDWNKLLSRIHPEEAISNPLYLRYTLLALSKKGELPNHLFALNPSPDCFYFYRSKDPAHEYFNSFFYASLGVYNEAVRQAFEAALINEAGMNFRTLRLLTDWFLKMGNIPLTEKYLAILRHSTCHSAWIQQREPLLDELKQKPPLTPDKSKHDIFIGSYPFVLEMWELLRDDPGNLRIQEYFLCSLLLNKELKQFETALSGLPYLQQKQPLPLCFQEALIILHSQQINDISDKYQLSQQLLQNHEAFMQLFSSQSKETVSAQFRGSYWTYFYE